MAQEGVCLNYMTYITQTGPMNNLR